MHVTGEHDADHHSVVGGLDPALRRQLTAQSDRSGLVRLGLQFGVVVGSGAYVALGLPFWPAALVVEALFLTFLFAPLHECIHHTAFRTDRLNRFASMVCGFLILLPPAHFRYFHMAHHRFTHDPERDPELVVPKPETLGAHLFYLTGLAEWRHRITGLIGQSFGGILPEYVPPRARRRVRCEARIFLATYSALILVSAMFGSLLLVWVWVLPNLIGQPLMRGYLLAEHTRCPHVANMLCNTRTTFTNAAVRWLAWNMPFHIEHHAYPAVPFHQLPELHAHIRKALGTTAKGYVAFNTRHIAELNTR